MNKRELEQKLRSIHQVERGFVPDSVWIERTKVNLMQKIEQGGSMSIPIKVRPVRSWMASPFRFLRSLRQSVLATLSIFGVMAGGSIASVSAAENALPRDFLYPVKLATEQVRLVLTKSKTDKLKLKTDFIDRRRQEIKTIASSNDSQRQGRIQDAAEMVKRDLDTVKTQLTEVSNQESAGQAAVAAKLVDQQSTALIGTLKDVKGSLSFEVRSKVIEAEAAAVNTGVKAVQVLIDTHDNPEAQGVMTKDELVESLQQKVQGLQDNVVDAAHALGVTVSTAASSIPGTSITVTSTVIEAVATNSVATSSLIQITDAQQALVQTQTLLREDKLDQLSSKLAETAKVIASVEKTVESLATSSTGAVPSFVTTTGMLSNIASGASTSSVGSSTGTSSVPTTNASGTSSITTKSSM